MREEQIPLMAFPKELILGEKNNCRNTDIQIKNGFPDQRKETCKNRPSRDELNRPALHILRKTKPNRD